MSSQSESSPSRGKKVTFDSQYGKGKTPKEEKKKEFRRVVSCERGANVSDDANTVVPQEDGPECRVDGQNWYVLSYAAPMNAKARSNWIMVKQSGSFPDEESAKVHAKKVWEQDKRFDVYVVKMYGYVRIPIPEDIKPFIQKVYDDKRLTQIMQGQYEATRQSRLEMEERMAQDRAKAEALVKKKHGQDYKMPEKSETVKKYEADKLEREVEASGMSFTQRDLAMTMIDYAKLMKAEGKDVDVTMLANMLRFAEIRKKHITQDEMQEQMKKTIGVSDGGAASADAATGESETEAAAVAVDAPDCTGADEADN